MSDFEVEDGKENQAQSRFAAAVVVMVLIDSLHFVFAQLLLPYLPPTTSSFYYMTMAFIQVAIFAAVRREIDWRVFRDHAGFFLAIGFLVAAATAMSFTAVFYIDPGTAAMVARMDTIFSLAFGIFWLKEYLAPGEKVGALLAVLGVFVISFQPGGESSRLWLGSLLVLGSTFFYALHAAIVKRQGGDIDFLNFFLFRMGSASLFLFLFTVGRGELVWPSGWQVWLILLVTATVNVTISRSLYYLVLRRIDLSILTILLTLSPLMTVIWSLALFGERPSLQGMLGGAAVISGVLLVTIGRRRERVGERL
ncbi:MAG: DMT family transporter [Candidatus Promineifilaceae bacterium]